MMVEVKLLQEEEIMPNGQKSLVGAAVALLGIVLTMAFDGTVEKVGVALFLLGFVPGVVFGFRWRNGRGRT